MRGLWELFDRAARLRPDAPAVSDTSSTLAYGELRERSMAVAATLVSAGIERGAPVVLVADRTTDSIAGILAIACAGATYVPVDPAEPAARFDRIVEGSGAIHALADDYGSRAAEQAGLHVIDLADCAATPMEDVRTRPSRVAYVLFTSGSTGVPKGVEVTHANVEALLLGARTWAGVGEGDVWASFHAFTFDISMWEIWGSLTTGGHLVMVPRLAQLDVSYLAEILSDFEVMHLCQTPTAIRWLAAHVAREGVPASLRTLFICGERLGFGVLATFEEDVRRGALRAWNLYGPTETTIYATGYPIATDDVLHEKRSLIGRALPHVSVHLAPGDEEADVGEILIAGPGVADGYRGDPELTAERFVDTVQGRAYRTGDLARPVEEDGLEFVGRSGGFVKIRGYRIEPDEIVAALCAHSDVDDAAVCATSALPGGETLVAAVVRRAGSAASDAALRRHAAALLPEYMRPTRIMLVDALPRLPSAKLDQKALKNLVEERLGVVSGRDRRRSEERYASST